MAGDLIHLSSAALLLSYLLFYDVEVNLLIKLLLFAVIVWIMVRGWTWVILAAILINILVREPRFSGGMIGWDSLFYAGFVCVWWLMLLDTVRCAANCDTG